MGFFGKIARSAGRGVVLGSSAALRGGGRILAVHVLPDEIIPSWKTQKRLKKAGSLISSPFSQSGKKKKAKPGASAKKTKKTAAPGSRSNFGGSQRKASAPAGAAPKIPLLSNRFFRGLPGFDRLPQLRAKKREIDLARSFRGVDGDVLPGEHAQAKKNAWGRGDGFLTSPDWLTVAAAAPRSAPASRLARSRGLVESRRSAARPAAVPLQLFAPSAAGVRSELNSYPFTPSRVSRAVGRKKSFRERRDLYS